MFEKSWWKTDLQNPVCFPSLHMYLLLIHLIADDRSRPLHPTGTTDYAESRRWKGLIILPYPTAAIDRHWYFTLGVCVLYWKAIFYHFCADSSYQLYYVVTPFSLTARTHSLHIRTHARTSIYRYTGTSGTSERKEEGIGRWRELENYIPLYLCITFSCFPFPFSVDLQISWLHDNIFIDIVKYQ